MRYAIDFKKRFSKIVEAESEEEAIKEAIKELYEYNNIIELGFDEDDVENVEILN